MNISHTIILTLCFLLFNYCIHSQKNINNSDRLLYIPYNEYGKWGWCDTLGNIVIEPKYLLTDFFHKSRYKNKLLAQVDTKSGINFIDKNGRLIIPKRFKTGEKFYQKYENTSGEIENRELLLIENKSSKKGLYDLVSESVVVPVKYDSIFSINHSGVGHIYIKGQEQTLLKLEEGSFRLE
ncbi:MAG: WG repeat-containing protein, partial [Bacteroidota bacterium]